MLDIGNSDTGAVVANQIVETPFQEMQGRKIFAGNIKFDTTAAGRYWVKVTLVSLQRRNVGDAAVSFALRGAG